MSENTSTHEPAGESDGSLILRYLESGDDQAGEVLIRRHAGSIYRFLYSMIAHPHDCEDLSQLTFARAFAALPTYRDGGRFRSWLFRIAKNEALGLLRRRRARPEIVREIEEPDLQARTTEEDVASRDSLRSIDAALAALPREEGQIVLLRVREGLTFREIAELTDTPLGTVLSRMSSARNRLRPSLQSPLP